VKDKDNRFSSNWSPF